jgi:hypothetical protein
MLANLHLLGAADTPQAHECQNNRCTNEVSPARYALGYKTCLACGDKAAVVQRQSWCIAPISNKAAYTLITDYDLLKQINPKRTT